MMRDEEKTIDLRLDGKQVVSIVLGSAALLGIVFYLGVTVGRDLTAAPSAPADPLGVLDERAERRNDSLTFADELTRTDRAPVAARAPEQAKAPVEKPAAEKAETEKAAAAEEPAAEKVAEAEARATATDASARPTEGAPGEAAEPHAAEPAKAAVRDLSAALLQAGNKADAKAQPPADPGPKSPPAPKVEASGGGGFTVQVASLPNRAEADALASRLRKQGLSPWVAAADIPGKGTFFRVRVGRFASRDEAVRYLDDLKRETRMDGFVAAVEG